MNYGGNSNAVEYLIGDDFIIVQFASGRHTLYKYTYESAGKAAIETMKRLAQAGQGLNSFVSTKMTQPSYSARGNLLEELS
jgi:hypothetical protein